MKSKICVLFVLKNKNLIIITFRDKQEKINLLILNPSPLTKIFLDEFSKSHFKIIPIIIFWQIIFSHRNFLSENLRCHKLQNPWRYWEKLYRFFTQIWHKKTSKTKNYSIWPEKKKEKAIFVIKTLQKSVLKIFYLTS